MSNKYVIKNCPCFEDEGTFYNCVNERIEGDCQDCTDCILKQIVELAKGNIGTCANCEAEPPCDNICDTYRLNKILQLLDIQEVE